MKKINFNTLFENDRFLKIISVVIATIIWVLVLYTVDTEKAVTINDIPVNINLAGTSADSNGLSVVDPTPRFVNYKIRGVSYEVGKLKTDNFKATLEIPDISEPGLYPLKVVITQQDTDITFEEVSLSQSIFMVEFDRFVETTFKLEASAPNKEAAEGFIIDQCTTTPKEIKVKGPENIMKSIDKCVLENTDKMIIKNSTAIEGTLKFLDDTGKEIASNYLTYNYKAADFKISIPLYKKATLPLTFSYINVPDGIDTTKIPFAFADGVNKINVAIPVDAASGVDKIDLGQLDFRKVGLETSHTFDISLLAGYINLDEINKVTVDFGVDEAHGYGRSSLTATNIVVKNIPAGYTTEIVTKQLADIQLVGEMEVLGTLTAADIVVTADLSKITNFSEGELRVPATITVKDNKQAWAIGEKTVTISAKKE